MRLKSEHRVSSSKGQSRLKDRWCCDLTISSSSCHIPRSLCGISRQCRIRGFAAANGHDGKTDDEVRTAMGDKFPKHIYHSIICIGALVAHQEEGRWQVDAVGAPHVGDRSEKALIASFVDRIAELSPQLVTFNGSSFDLPVLRYRAMVHC